jgi:hypothetical protein
MSRYARLAAAHAAAAAAAAALVLWFGPPGMDLAAHVYQRALFLQQGFSLWNNYWYAGRYSFVSRARETGGWRASTTPPPRLEQSRAGR